MTGDIVEAMRLLGAGLAMLGAIGAGVGVGPGGIAHLLGQGRDQGLVLPDLVLHRDPAVIEGIAMDLVDRYSGTGPEFDPVRDAFRGQVSKRVGLEFVERSRATWDHRKLAGTY